MMTKITRPAGGNRNTQLEQAAALKALIGSASLALTLAGWALLSHQQAALNETASASLPTPAEQAGITSSQPVNAEAVAPAVTDPLPTLAPLYTPGQVNDVRSGQTDSGTQATAARTNAPQAAAPQAQLRAVKAPPRPVAVTRSSR